VSPEEEVYEREGSSIISLMEGECSLFGKEKLTAFLKTFPISCPSILTVYCVIKAAVAPSTLGDLIDERVLRGRWQKEPWVARLMNIGLGS
jgi:hypothetical protein